MNLFKGISNKIEGWLFKEEIENAQNQPSGSMSDISPEQAEELLQRLKEIKQRIDEEVAFAKQEMKVVMEEDHTVSPTQSDIDRYFKYHTNYVSNVAHASEKSGMWVTNEQSEINKEDFSSKGRIEGWAFLRKSCGLPQGKLDSEPWKTSTPTEWTTK